MLTRARTSAIAMGLLASFGAMSACQSSSSAPPAALRVEADGAARGWKLVEIEALPAQEVTVDGSVYRGASLTRVLPRQLGAGESVLARGAETQTLSYAAASRPDCIVAHSKDGRGLSAAEGPLRIVLADSPDLSVENLVELRVEKPR